MNSDLRVETLVAGATDQVTEQVAQEQPGLDRSLDRLTEVQWHIVGYADVPRSQAVRGILCNRCNTVIGLCEDDSKLLSTLARYLRKCHG